MADFPRPFLATRPAAEGNWGIDHLQTTLMYRRVERLDMVQSEVLRTLTASGNPVFTAGR